MLYGYVGVGKGNRRAKRRRFGREVWASSQRVVDSGAEIWREPSLEESEHQGSSRCCFFIFETKSVKLLFEKSILRRT